jgi:hypothetical protein
MRRGMFGCLVACSGVRNGSCENYVDPVENFLGEMPREGLGDADEDEERP